ncbi:P-loop containing nucleoside triphosphate hydrolase protein [Thelonectria olida]|uniref:P-loop containing nucleoside triphosphate hydrolase protein n=1 Tax=Thelonectria olida TaxID=1576542 RepID=A0A9P8WAY2_9HYPO|nr:P-loop containing nucleoside triphosphate hydrolase protein [Thelonectria olida]
MDPSPHFHGSVTGHNTIAATHASHGGVNNFYFNGQAAAPGPLQPSASRKPLSTVPFPPDTNFVGRPDILDWISERLASPGARAALVGLGGIGKSQIAIHYAHQVRDQSPHKHVFWVHASSEERFKQDYQLIANRLELPGRSDPNTNVLRLVFEWLSMEENGLWEIILDNADDANVLFSTAQAPLASFLPKSRNGLILVTSRNKDTANRLVGDDRNIYKVQPMEHYQASQLLRDKLGETCDQSLASELLSSLDYMPLAITHAAAFINNRAPDMSVARYLEEFRSSDKKKESLLRKEVGDLRRDESASSSIIKTWQMTFEKIRHEDPSASDLLIFMSLFNPHGIPGFSLRGYMRHCKGSEDDIDDDIDVLFQYSLVTKTDSDMFEMHMLVQLCTKAWLSTFGNTQEWDQRFLQVMAAVYPKGYPEDIAVCQVLEPHLDGLLAGEPIDMTHMERLANLLLKTGRYRCFRGRNNEAEKMIRRSLQLKESLVGEWHPDTLDALHWRAVSLNLTSGFREAEQICRQAYDISVRILGRQHETSFRFLLQLASSLISKGDFIGSEQILRSALETSEQVLGGEHELTMDCRSRLAEALAKLGMLDAALEMKRSALERSERVFGPEHFNTITYKADVARILSGQGKYKEAEQEFRSVLEVGERVWGSEHSENVWAMVNLAVTLGKQGARGEEQLMLQRCLDVSQRILGQDHHDTAWILFCLADNAYQQADISSAAVLYERAYRGFWKVVGPHHPETKRCFQNLQFLNQAHGIPLPNHPAATTLGVPGHRAFISTAFRRMEP